MRGSARYEISSSSSTLYEGAGIGDRFRWDSIRKFILFASIYSSSVLNFDLFSKVCYRVPRFVDFVICELTVGITFMFMDTFIKQYTRRFDSNKYLNPLLKGISYGTFMQCVLWTLIHVIYLSDSARFLAAGIRDVPAWSVCRKTTNASCVPTKDVMLRCSQNKTTPFSLTSAEFNYVLVFINRDRSTITLRLFIIGFVWLLVFAVGSMAEEILIKIFRLAFICRIFFALSTTICLLVSTSKSEVLKAFSHILDVSTPISYPAAMRYVVYAYGIGFLGIYDFGAISPYTIIDIAILLFMVFFSIMSLVTSWTLRMMYEIMIKCVEVDVKLSTHRLLHSVLPLATQFLYVHKLYAINVFGDVLMSNSCFVVIMVVTMARFLHFEYRSVKPTYLIGILCCVGVCLSIPIVTLTVLESGSRDLVDGVDAAMYLLSGLKVAIIMWVYGVKKFANDIHFWLGFKPTKFWMTIWSLLPVALFSLFLHKLLRTTRSQNGFSYYSSVWFSFTCIIVILIEIKTVINYLMDNDFLGLFEAHKYYGPPDADDRKRRLNYNEVMRQRKCRHNCIVIDEWYDCNHFLTASESLHMGDSSSEESLMNIYVASDQPTGPVLEIQE